MSTNIPALLLALEDQAQDKNLSEPFRRGIKFAIGYIRLWEGAPADDPVVRRYKALVESLERDVEFGP